MGTKILLQLKICMSLLVLGTIGYYAASCNDPVPKPNPPDIDFSFHNINIEAPEMAIIGEEVLLLCYFETTISKNNRGYRWTITDPDGQESMSGIITIDKNISGAEFSTEYSFVPEKPGIYKIKVELRNRLNADLNQEAMHDLEVVEASSFAVTLSVPTETFINTSLFFTSTLDVNFANQVVDYQWTFVLPDGTEVISERARNQTNYNFEATQLGEHTVSLMVWGPEGFGTATDSATFDVVPDEDEIPASIPCAEIEDCGDNAFYELSAGSCLPKSDAIPAENLIAEASFETLIVEDILNAAFNSVIPDNPLMWRANNVDEAQASFPEPSLHSIAPVEGDWMLRFRGVGTDASNLFQSVPLSQERLNQLEEGDSLSVTFSAYVNRIQGNESTDTEFDLQLMAFSGDPTTWQEQFFDQQQLTTVFEQFFSDDCVNTWEKIEVVLPRIPAETTFLGARVIARENIEDDPEGDVEFDGHYVDVVTLEIND